MNITELKQVYDIANLDKNGKYYTLQLRILGTQNYGRIIKGINAIMHHLEMPGRAFQFYCGIMWEGEYQ